MGGGVSKQLDESLASQSLVLNISSVFIVSEKANAGSKNEFQ